MKVLIVDDVELNARLLGRLFYGIAECELVDSGAAALSATVKALETGDHYDLICLDIMMPGMDGITCLKKIREIESIPKFSGQNPAKILMVTTLKDEASVVQSIQSGCDGYLVKPVDKYTLHNQLKKIGLIASGK